MPSSPTVTDTTTGTVIPPADPANPDPLNTVNVTVAAAPNARSEGEGQQLLDAGCTCVLVIRSGCLVRLCRSARPAATHTLDAVGRATS